MRESERGSVSIYLLIVALIIAATAQLALLWSKEAAARNQAELLQRQLRMLNNSFFNLLKNEEQAAGERQLFAGTLHPGKEAVAVTVKSQYSSDNLLNFLEVRTAAATHSDAEQRLCQLSLSVPAAQIGWGGSYALASKTLEGAEYLPAEAIYIQASTEEVKLPAVNFFSSKAISSVTAEDLADEGLSRRFYYLPSGNAFAFTPGLVVHGSSVFINKGSIDIGDNAYFPDRVAIYSQNGSITLGENVRLAKALVHAYATVTIGSGCRINGLVIARKIILQGSASFSADAGVVAPFASCAYSN